MKGGYIVHTGAWESALNINIAPKISIRKPINQDLLKAYALITWMPITTINYKIWFNWACMKIKRVVIYIKKKEPWTWKRVGEEWRCPFSEELCRCCFRLLLLTLKESIPTSPISLFLSRSLARSLRCILLFLFLNNMSLIIIIHCLVRFRLALAEVWSYQIFIFVLWGVRAIADDVA